MLEACFGFLVDDAGGIANWDAMLILRLLFWPLRLPFYFWHKLTGLRRPGDILMHRIPDRFVPAHPTGLLSLFSPDSEMTFAEYLSLLDFFEKNSHLQFLVYQASHLHLSWSQVNEIARRLERIAKSGKQLIAFSEGGDLKSLYLLSVAERRFASPHASFLCALPSGESYFLKDTLGLFGIRVETSYAGKFKAGGFETFTRNDYSSEGKKSSQRLLKNFRSQMLAPFAEPSSATNKERKATQKKAAARSSHQWNLLIQKYSILSAKKLEEAAFFEARIPAERLFFHLFTEETQEKEVKPKHPFTNRNAELRGENDSTDAPESPNGHFVSEKKKKNEKANKELQEEIERERRRLKAQKRLTDERRLSKKKYKKDFPIIRLRRRPSLALVPLNGPIYLGRPQAEPQLDSIQALPLRPVLEELMESPEEAVFLQINSPGGSADASELLYQSIAQLAEKKPVFAIVDGVAASGGYYIACAANQIYASPMSLVGSIGVIRLRPELSGLYKKLKVKKKKIFYDPTADIFSEAGPMSPASQRLNKEGLKEIYELFLKRVAEGRSLPVRQVKKWAEGQVFTGADYFKAGMIDGCLDLYEVIDYYKKEAGYKESTEFQINPYPSIKLNLRTIFQTKYGPIPFQNEERGISKDMAKALWTEWQVLQFANEARPLLLCPGLYGP